MNKNDTANSTAMVAQSSYRSVRLFTECRLRLESVKLEKQMIVNGQESKCYSVEPVLRCLNGCHPVRTTPVTIGFHCLPTGECMMVYVCFTEMKMHQILYLAFLPTFYFTDSNLNRSEGLSRIYEKSVDLMETVDAHVACRCTAHCA